MRFISLFHELLTVALPYQGINECCRNGNPKPRGKEPHKVSDVLPDDVLHHLALQPGHVDGEEGPDDQDQGVEGEYA